MLRCVPTIRLSFATQTADVYDSAGLAHAARQTEYPNTEVVVKVVILGTGSTIGTFEGSLGVGSFDFGTLRKAPPELVRNADNEGY